MADPSVIQILEKAFRGDLQAAKMLEDAMNADFPRYLHTLATAFADEGQPEDMRQLAATQIVNSLSSKDPQKNKELALKWLRVAENQRTHIKQTILQCLASPHDLVSTGAASVVARIGVIELQVRKWQDLIDMLVNGTRSNNPKPFLETLGYICQDMPVGYIEDKAFKILEVIFGCLTKEAPVDVQRESMKALLNTLDFISHNFAQEKEADLIMSKICEMTQHEDQKLQILSLQCLFTIAGLYYKIMPRYMQTLYQITMKVLTQSKDEEVQRQAVEFWTTIAEKESDLLDEIEDAKAMGKTPKVVCHHFIAGAMQELVPMLLDAMQKQDPDAEDEDETVHLAASCCLIKVALVVEDKLLPHVWPFITQNVDSTEWRKRDAAIQATGSIIEGMVMAGDDARQSLLSVTRSIINHVTDENEMVKDTAAWALGRIVSAHQDLVPGLLKELLVALVSAMKDDTKIASHACWTMMKVIETFAPMKDKPTSPLSPLYRDIMKVLIECADRPDADLHHLRVSAYANMAVLIHNGALDTLPMMDSVIQEILRRIELTFSAGNMNVKLKEEIQESFIDVMLRAAARLEEKILPLSQQFMAIFLRFLGTTSAVEDDALTGIGIMALALGEQFASYLPSTLPKVVEAMQQYEQTRVVTAAVCCLSDISRAVSTKLVPNAKPLIQALLQALQNESLSNHAKIAVIGVFGDMALALREHFEPFVNVALLVFANAGQLMEQLPRRTEEDLADVESLKEQIVDGYIGLFTGLRGEPNSKAVLLNDLEKVFILIRAIYFADDTYEETRYKCVLMIGDVAMTLGVAAEGVLKSKATEEILMHAMQSAQMTNLKDGANWACGVINKMK